MKYRSVQILTAVALIAGAARTASAADQSGAWSLSILGGDSVGESGSLRSPGRTTITDLGSLDPALAGASGTLSLDRLKYEDLFKRRFDTGLELDYSFTDNLQTYGRFSYESLGGRTRGLGELSGEAITSPTFVTARFADEDNSSLELGSRYYWSTGSNWRPFAGVALGATHMDAIRASLATPTALPDLNNLRFTRTGTVFSQSAETGVEYNPTQEFGVRLSLDASHFGAPPSADDARLTGLGFNPGDDARGRWSFPVAIAANYHF
jgi:opacity protein-like surface antigen